MRRTRTHTPSPPTNPPEPSHHHANHLVPSIGTPLDLDEGVLLETWSCRYEIRRNDECDATATATYRLVNERDCEATDGQHAPAGILDVVLHDPKGTIEIEAKCANCGKRLAFEYEYNSCSPPTV